MTWAIAALVLALGAGVPDAPAADDIPVSGPAPAARQDSDHPLWTRSLRAIPQLAAAAALTVLWFVVLPAGPLGCLAGVALGGTRLCGPIFLAALGIALLYAGYLLFYYFGYVGALVVFAYVGGYVAAEASLGWLASANRGGKDLLRVPARAAVVTVAGLAVVLASVVEAAALGVAVVALAGVSLLVMPRAWQLWTPQSESRVPDDDGRVRRAGLASACNTLAWAVPCAVLILPPVLAANAALAHPLAVLGGMAAEDFVVAQFSLSPKRRPQPPRVDDDEENR